jgi:hypothetical protein
MDDQFSSNKNIIIAIVIGIIIVIIVCYVVTRYACPQTCTNTDFQNKVADDIKQKLKELDLCDCESSPTKSSRSERFGNINFY